jgi:hypothetical protein
VAGGSLSASFAISPVLGHTFPFFVGIFIVGTGLKPVPT